MIWPSTRKGLATAPLAVRPHWSLKAKLSLLGGTLFSLGIVAGGSYWLGSQMAEKAFLLRQNQTDTAQKNRQLEISHQQLEALVAKQARQLQLELNTREALQKQLRHDQAELAHQRESTAFFEGMLNTNSRETGHLGIARFNVSVASPTGEYPYRLLLSQGPGAKAPFSGYFEMVLKNKKGEAYTLGGKKAPFLIQFKNYTRIQNTVTPPAGFIVHSVEFKIYEGQDASPVLVHTTSPS